MSTDVEGHVCITQWDDAAEVERCILCGEPAGRPTRRDDGGDR